MMFLRKARARTRRNLLGRPYRGPLSLADVAGRARDELLDLMDLGYGLPILGATTPQNQQAAVPVYYPYALVVTSDQAINQNDMVWWDPVNYTLKALTAVSQVAVGATGGFCGVAAGTSNPGVYPNPPAGAAYGDILPGIVVQRGGTAFLNGTVGDGAYNHFQPVTVGADAQTVTRGGETTADRVGFVFVRPPTNPRGASGATPVGETDAGTRIRVWIESKFPTTVLL